jgi:hypothetical protein
MNRRKFLAGASAAPLMWATPQGSDESGLGSSIFDGKSLEGWSVQDGPETAFYVKDGAIVVHEGAGYPAWLRSARQYENFDFRGEFFVKGWTDSGIYLHAPEHGRSMSCGMKLHIFHQVDATPAPESMGSVFPVVAPLKVNVKNQSQWNSFRILMDWPRLHVWTNDEMVQDLDVETVPELRHRLRSGYLGLESLSYPIRFRNLRVRELPSKNGTSPMANRSSNLSAPCSTATASATSPPRRSFAISSCRCTCATPGITMAASCSAPPDRDRAAATTKSSCTTWKARTTPPDRSIPSNGPAIRG